jgi:hypothetical protein
MAFFPQIPKFNTFARDPIIFIEKSSIKKGFDCVTIVSYKKPQVLFGNIKDGFGKITPVTVALRKPGESQSAEE